MKLRDLARAVGGTVAGDGDVEVAGFAEIERAEPGTIVMVRDARHLPQAEAGRASAVLLPESVPVSAKPAIRCVDVRLAFARGLEILHPAAPPAPGVHPTAVVGEGTHLGREVSLGPYAVIGAGCVIGDRVVIGSGTVVGRDVTVGDETVLFPHVTIYDRTVIGRRVILHSGGVIGSDGFGYAAAAGRQVKIPHVGRVVIEDDVEIGANTAVDRATLGETRIGAGTKIDNVVQVGHNVTIGRNVVIVALSGISGSVEIGDGAVLAGRVGVVDHVKIGAGAMVLAGAAVRKDVAPGEVVWGVPARLHRDELAIQASLGRLPDLLKRVTALERAAGSPPAPAPRNARANSASTPASGGRLRRRRG